MRCGKRAIVTDSLTNAEGVAERRRSAHHTFLSAPLSAPRRGEQVMRGEAKGKQECGGVGVRRGEAGLGWRGGAERVTFRGIMSL